MYFEWKGLTINNSFNYACQNWGHRAALVYGESQFSYEQLQREVHQMTCALQNFGVGKGTRLAYLLSASPEWITLFYAGLNLGAIMVPLNLSWIGREIEQGLKLTDADVLVFLDEMRGKDYASILEDQFPELIKVCKDDIQIERLPNLKKIISLSASNKKYPYAHDFYDVKETGAEFNAKEIQLLGDSIAPDDVCAFMLTSGSTGFPKPVIHTNNSILFNIANMADCHEVQLDDRFLHIAPTYHVAGIELFLMMHLRGGLLYLADYFEPELAMRIIEKERINMMWGFDVHYLMMRRHPHYTQYDLSSLEKIMIGNSPGSYDEIKTIGVPHHGNIYGSTENGGAHAHFPYRHRSDQQSAKYSNGMPLSFVETRIVEPETGELLGVNQPGEICSKGPGHFKGYYNMPEETAESIDQDGFYHSGDYGWIDEKGFLYYRGRIKDTVKTGGENVSTREVEILLETETPWVNTAFVFAVPDCQWGEAVTAMVELKPSHEVSEKELKEHCRNVMAGYKIPKRFIFVEPSEWIITQTGKFDKNALRAKAMQVLGIDEPV